ncbi:polysaccharide biosynthesis C-terminal domain-containing protein [Haladaptatus sp. GCM10025707]|uniref:oligosaccharide flippase family protein n=1 Tax=unclassified Haladaptatus TaxID=2622732 RepID=UPI0023E75C1E|nr:polysaccharide biosynthesis C-terminal domain-containing protein [Haladaptatus sp. QDMS2]
MDFAKSTVKVFIANLVATIIGFVGIAFFAQELGPHLMGTFFLFQALLTVISIPADIGISNGVAKRISEGQNPGKTLSSALILKTITAAGIAGIVLLSRDYVNDFLGGEFAVYLAVGIVLQEFAKLSIELLQGELKVGKTALPTVAQQVVFVGAGSILVGLGFGVVSLIYALLLGFISMLGIGFFRSSTGFGRPTISRMRNLFDYSKYAVISTIGGHTFNWMDVAIIGVILTQADVGVYEVAWRVSVLTLIFSKALGRALFPQISKWASENEISKINEIISESMTLSLFLVIPAFFGSLLYSQEILSFVFGPEYAVAWIVLIILLAEKIFQAIHIVAGQALLAIDRPELAARATVISIITNLVLNIILILEFGIIGAAIATAISSLLNDILHIKYVYRYVSIKTPWKDIIWLLFAATVMLSMLYVAEFVLPTSSLPVLIAKITLGVIIYSSVIVSRAETRTKIKTNISRISPY